jgi:hypothetical protein
MKTGDVVGRGGEKQGGREREGTDAMTVHMMLHHAK